jgi:cytochrome P450
LLDYVFHVCARIRSGEPADLSHRMAGFETSAQGIGYALWQLARHQDLQQQLREEIYSVSNPTFDDYDSKMPFLDAVIKERYTS